MTPPITEFKGQYRFLSNFYHCHVGIWMDGEKYPCVENAYQAAKTLEFADRRPFHYSGAIHYGVNNNVLTPGEAKRKGRTLHLQADWERIKLGVMLGLVRQKFDGRDSLLQTALLQTGDAKLVESNYWNDVYWGVCNSVGENHLGKILMAVRAELRSAGGWQ